MSLSVEENRKIALLGDTANELAKLKEHPSWDVLKRVFADARQRAEKKMAREMFSGGENHPALDQREVDYRRGFLRGAQAVLDHPELAEKAFLKAMERTQDSG